MLEYSRSPRPPLVTRPTDWLSRVLCTIEVMRHDYAETGEMNFRSGTEIYLFSVAHRLCLNTSRVALSIRRIKVSRCIKIGRRLESMETLSRLAQRDEATRQDAIKMQRVAPDTLKCTWYISRQFDVRYRSVNNISQYRRIIRSTSDKYAAKPPKVTNGRV